MVTVKNTLSWNVMYTNIKRGKRLEDNIKTDLMDFDSENRWQMELIQDFPSYWTLILDMLNCRVLLPVC
jgi:hypothetical protein